MKYMEVPRPDGNGLCSDDECPCDPFGVEIPRGEGFIFISKEVVDSRMDCPSVHELDQKGEEMQKVLNAMILTGAGVFEPILMCEQGAKKRGIDLKVAAADARHWWSTGLVPLRPTPMADQKTGCFIATACCGSVLAKEVLLLEVFRDDVLIKSVLGRRLVSCYYRYSPPVASMIRTRSVLRTVIRSILVRPLAFAAKGALRLIEIIKCSEKHH